MALSMGGWSPKKFAEKVCGGLAQAGGVSRSIVWAVFVVLIVGFVAKLGVLKADKMDARDDFSQIAETECVAPGGDAPSRSVVNISVLDASEEMDPSNMTFMPHLRKFVEINFPMIAKSDLIVGSRRECELSLSFGGRADSGRDDDRILANVDRTIEAHVKRGSLPEILDRSMDIKVIPAYANPNGDNRNIGTEFSFSSVLRYSNGPFCGFISRVTETQGSENSESSNGGKDDFSNCQYFLPFSGCRASLVGASGVLLCLQILSLVVAGLLFAFAFVAGFFLRLNNTDPVCRWSGLAAMSITFPALLFFYGWALSGHPLWFWRTLAG